MRLRPDAPAPDTRVVLISITEADIQRLGGWPVPDGILARTLRIVGGHEPRAIGLDIYRDVPVPPGTDELDVVFRGDPRIVVVTKFGEGASSGVRPPAALRDSDQVGFNDILVDPGGIVRRGLLFLDDGQTVVHSFALRLALRYLAQEGVGAQADPQRPDLLRLGRTTIEPLEPNDGGYVGADARGYQFLLDFEGARRPFRSIELSTVLAGHLEPEAVRDRIVLIGVTAESIKDEFYTPYSRGLREAQYVPGVAVHGHIVSQLLRMALGGARPMRTPAEWQEALWTLLWSVAGALIGVAVRSPGRFALVVSTGLAVLGAFDVLAFFRGWWVPLAPPALGWLISAGGIITYLSHREAVQRALLMQLFSRQVSKEVAETIWQQREHFLDGGRPRSQRLVVTALFTDLTGFTTVSEKHPPEILMEWLNEYMDAMARQVSRHGGVIRQYAGDSVVALFGVPVPRLSEAETDRDAVSAVECALSMGEALRELNNQWRAEQRPTTGMRVGILTGPVVSGTIGSADRSEYVVVGDTMNTAARLESFDKDLFTPDPEGNPCRILIGEPTRARLGRAFETEWVGDVSLKGKAQLVGVYRVIGRAQEHPAPEQEGKDERRQIDRNDLHPDRRPDVWSWPVPGASNAAAVDDRTVSEPGGSSGRAAL
jgi:adenylate cyclase